MIRVAAPRDTLATELERVRTGAVVLSEEEVRVATDHQLLPLTSDIVGCWALTLDGELAFVAWDARSIVELVANHPVHKVGINAALALGSIRYPSLSSIRPNRPADARDCTTCDGQGHIAGMPARVRCACAGLGWLPRE